MQVRDREVLLGVTGSIAAYKACEVASLLTKLGIRVTTAMTASAREFAGPISFEAITNQRCITEMFAQIHNPDIEHIAVAQRVSLFLVAPATANILAKAAHGIADDWLSTTLLATTAPILFAPAMNTAMYEHAATQENIETLRSRGCHFVGPDSGLLACKTSGIGKMIAPETIVEAALPFVDPRSDFAGKRVLITAGANHEPIDPVRFLGNRSSGKMGRALALEALCRGAEVRVVLGPAEFAPPYGCEVNHVQTALEMDAAVQDFAGEADVVIGAAAVADYRVPHALAEKHKRGGEPPVIELSENPDIIGRVGAAKRPGQVVAGFAAETLDMAAHAKEKLAKKNLDFIVANQVGQPDSGFGAETLSALILDSTGGRQNLGNAPKTAVATALLDAIAQRLS